MTLSNTQTLKISGTVEVLDIEREESYELRHPKNNARLMKNDGWTMEPPNEGMCDHSRLPKP